MKKLGFTLTELLITLGIIGVAAALVAPVVTNLIPDKNKVLFMKNYNAVSTLTQKMLNDPELYYAEYKIAEENMDLDGDGETDVYIGDKYPTCIGLKCDVTKALKKEYSNIDFGTDHKYGYLLASYLGVDMGTFGGTVDSCYFTTEDGNYWSVYNDSDDAQEQIHITFDSTTNGTLFEPLDEKGKKSCKSFLLNGDVFGAVTPGDSLSKAYLINPNNMHDKKRDLACAKLIESDSTGKSPSEICADIYDDIAD